MEDYVAVGLLGRLRSGGAARENPVDVGEFDARDLSDPHHGECRTAGSAATEPQSSDRNSALPPWARSGSAKRPATRWGARMPVLEAGAS